MEFKLRYCTVWLYWAGHNLANEMKLLLIMPLMQDHSLDLLSSSPARYHCATDAPSGDPDFKWKMACVLGNIYIF